MGYKDSNMLLDASSTHTSSPTFLQPLYRPPLKSLIRPLLRITRLVQDAASKASIALIVGIALRIFSSSYASPFFWLAGSLFISRLVIKVAEGYHLAVFEKVKQVIYRLSETCPRARLVLSLCALFSGRKYAYLGEIAATALGVMGGVTIEIYHYQKLQQINRAVGNEKPPIMHHYYL
jgi:hypothetical protein